MSKETQYEVVPIEDLTPEQSYHVNTTEPTSSLEAGAAAVAGKGALEVAKVTPGVKRLTEMFEKTPSVEIGPITTETGANVPKTGGTTVPKTGGQKWNERLTGNSATGSQMDKASLAKNEEMMKAIGPGGELAGGELHGGNVLTGPDRKSSLKNVGIPELAHLPAGSPEYFEALDRYLAGQPVEPPKPIALTPAQRAMQVAQGIGSKAMGVAQPVMNALNSPIMQKLNPALVGLGYFGAGTEGMEAYKRAKHGDYGRALIDAIGAGGTLASIHAPHPAAKVLGLGAGLGAHYLNKKLDEKYGRDYATGGLVYIGK